MAFVHEVTTATLRALPMFAHTAEAALQRMARASMLRYVARDTLIVRAGEHSDFMHLILSGTLSAVAAGDDGREVIMSMLGPGELFGEMGVLTDESCLANVMAVTSSVLVVIAKKDFKRFMRENFDVAYFVLRKLIQRLREANRRIESLALFDVSGRVARVLQDMAETVSGKQVVTCKISKQSIAKMVGASRETVSRIVKDMELRGLIEVSSGQIVLREPEAIAPGSQGYRRL